MTTPPETDPQSPIEFVIHRPKVISRLWAAVLLLGAMSALLVVSRAAGLGSAGLGVLNVDEEASLSNWFQIVALLAGAVLVGIIAARKRAASEPNSRHWWGLATLLLVMSVDEAAGVHERASVVLRGAGLFGWVVPAVVLVLALGAVYARFVMTLPATTRVRLAAAAIVYLCGVLGLEALSRPVDIFMGGRDALPYQMLNTVEETLESAGIVLLLDAILRYLGGSAQSVSVIFRSR